MEAACELKQEEGIEVQPEIMVPLVGVCQRTRNCQAPHP